MERPALELSFADEAAFEKELRENLFKGRTFVPGAEGVGMREACVLRVIHPVTGEHRDLAAEAVWVQPDGPTKGIGLELPDVDPDELERFRVSGHEPSPAQPATPARPSGPPPGGKPEPKSVHERIRNLSMREQVVVARTGSLAERVALERFFGPAVWEALLSSPQLTPPEVARISKKGNLPRPLLASICANRSWLSNPEVQRALLGNPRLDSSQITSVLRALSRADLQRVPQQTAYRFAVRDAAKKLLR